MGRRSRKRAIRPAPGQPPGGEADGAGQPSGRGVRWVRDRARGGRSGTARRPAGPRPSAPWGSFPLSEIVVVVALAIGIAGLLLAGRTGIILLLVALGLGSLAGLELALREHLAGHRSHSTVLGGVAAIAAGLPLFFTGAPRWLVLVVAAAVFAIAFSAAREVFKRRAGGIGFR